MTNTLADAKIQIEEAPPMNGWPLVLVTFQKAAAPFATGRLLFLCLDYFQQQWYDVNKNISEVFYVKP